MKIIKELESHGSLFNEATLVNILEPLDSIDNLSADFFESQRVFYYTESSRSLRDYSLYPSDDAVFKIVKFTNTRNFFNDPWSFGFVKRKTSDGLVWTGAYAGRHGELFMKLKKLVRSNEGARVLLSKVDFPRAITRVDVFRGLDIAPFAAELYEDLDDLESWDCLGGVKGLKVYLKNLTYVARSKALCREVMPEEYKLIKTKAGYNLIFNSGLLDKYSNFIVLKVELVLCNNSFLSEPYHSVKSLGRAANLSEYGLEEAPIPIPLISKTGVIFPSDKIQMQDSQGIDHIFRGRYNRLSEELQNCSSEFLYSALKNSVELTLKRVKVDTQYLVPFYNMKWDRVSYLMPLYVSHIRSNVPLCAVVIGEVSPNVWAPVTVLKLETARSNARLLGRLHASWLTNVKGGTVHENSGAQG